MNANPQKNSSSLHWAERYARLLDSKFRLPGTSFRFGIDPLIGLIPGLGDGVSLIFQLMLVFSLLKHGSSGRLRALLIINVLVDTLIGSIPIVGGVFDFFFKANQRNLRLVREHIYEGKHQGSGKGVWIALLMLIILTLGLLIYMIIWLIQWMVSLFS